MEVIIVGHARQKMGQYEVSELQVIEALAKPDSILEGKYGRRIAQKRLNGLLLRVVYESHEEWKVVVTVYKAKAGRYEVRI